MQKRVWITWETQRRSIELAKKLGCDLYIIEYKGLRRYPLSIVKTLAIIRKNRPDILFVQNPSMILAALVCLYKIIFRINVVVDRHTTFFLHNKNKGIIYTLIFKLLHHFTIRFADLTIVTNEGLAKIVRQMKGNPFILPDKIPDFKKTNIIQLKGKYNIFMISSFNTDEPIEAVFQAISLINRQDVYLYVSGNYNKLDNNLIHNAPSNIIFTGFLSEQEFTDMLFSVDAVMVLTTADYTMLCGCYEAVSVCRPLITSDKDVLTDYFKGACFVNNTPEGIAKGIQEVIDNIDGYKSIIEDLKKALLNKWECLYNDLENILGHY